MPLFRARTKPFIGLGATDGTQQYWLPATVQGSNTTFAMVADTVYFMPFRLPGLVINRIGFEVTTGVAGNAKVALYANNDGLPGALLVDGGAVATTTTSTTPIGATISDFVMPEWVWGAIVSNATATLRGAGNGLPGIMGSDIGLNHRGGFLASLTYPAGAMPSTATTPTDFLSSTAWPKIVLWKV